MKNILEEINLLANNSPYEFVQESENEYREQLEGLAKLISANPELKIVCIAGPSSSGKTTTAHILCDFLKSNGRDTFVLSLDDFYHTYAYLPVLPDGTKDTESVNALDIKLLEKCFCEIINTGKTYLPKFDFISGKRITNHRFVDISENNGIIIVEGLHALNPKIAELVPNENIYKIYISVNCPIKNKSGELLLSSRQIRLIRRSLRDRIFRNTDINSTLKMWQNVVNGEKKYLYCFKNTADVNLVTLHPYELCVYKNSFLQLESEVKSNSPSFDFFINTVNSLKMFNSIDSSLVPKNSLIREFLGEGEYN